MATGKLTALSFGVAADDWNVLQTAHPNVLLIGSDPAVTGFLQLLLPLLQPPVVHTTDGTLTLPAGPGGTLILRDVQKLGAGDQQRLSEWMAEPDAPDAGDLDGIVPALSAGRAQGAGQSRCSTAST